MIEPDDEVIVEINAVLNDRLTLLSIARDSDLQRQAIIDLQHLFYRLAGLKSEYVTAGDEERANLILGFECVADCMQSELMMWLFLKMEDPEKAWDCLIQAQRAAGASVRTHPGFSRNEHHLARLEAIEKLVFPPQSFVSAGLLVDGQVCSTCGQDYESCSHVAGNPYWGEFCSICPVDVELDHGALVTNPDDKRCRVFWVEDDGVRRNKMTGKAMTPAEIARRGEFSVRMLMASGSRIDPREALVSRADQDPKARRRSKSPRRPKEQGTGGASHPAKDRRTGPSNRSDSA